MESSSLRIVSRSLSTLSFLRVHRYSYLGLGYIDGLSWRENAKRFFVKHGGTDPVTSSECIAATPLLLQTPSSEKRNISNQKPNHVDPSPDPRILNNNFTTFFNCQSQMVCFWRLVAPLKLIAGFVTASISHSPLTDNCQFQTQRCRGSGEICLFCCSARLGSPYARFPTASDGNQFVSQSHAHGALAERVFVSGYTDRLRIRNKRRRATKWCAIWVLPIRWYFFAMSRTFEFIYIQWKVVQTRKS